MQRGHLLVLDCFTFPAKKPVPDVSYDLMRVTAGEKPIVASADERRGISDEIATLKLRGDAHGGIGGSSGSGQGVPHIDVELIAFEPITKEAQLAIPEAGYALYVLRNGVWTAHPSILKKDRRMLTIEPGTDPHYDGGRLRLGKETNFHSFTWYPVIPKGSSCVSSGRRCGEISFCIAYGNARKVSFPVTSPVARPGRASYPKRPFLRHAPRSGDRWSG